MTVDELLGIVRTPSFSDDSLRAAIESFGAAQRIRCRIACRKEQVDAEDAEDSAYNAGCMDCEQAIRALRGNE